MKLKSHTDMASRYITVVIEGLKVAFPGRASAFGTSFNHFATAFVKNLRLDLRLEFIKHQSASDDQHSSVRFDPLSHAARCADEASIGQRISIDFQAAFGCYAGDLRPGLSWDFSSCDSGRERAWRHLINNFETVF